MSVLFVSRFRKVYGPIFSLKLGSWKTVVAGNQEAIKEILVTKSTDFAGRPQLRSFMELTFGKFKLELLITLKIAFEEGQLCKSWGKSENSRTD